MTITGTDPGLARARLRFSGVVRSEWIKLRTLRSTVWIAIGTVLTAIALSMIFGSAAPQLNATLDPSLTNAFAVQVVVQAATIGLPLAQLPIAVLGVLSMSGEFTSGSIRATFTAVPRRLWVLAGKLVVLTALTLVVGLAITFGSYALTAPVLSSAGVTASLLDPDVTFRLLGGAIVLPAIAALALGIGTIIRSTVAAIATVAAILLVLPPVFSILGQHWAQTIVGLLPTSAGSILYSVATAPGSLEPWAAALVLLAWSAASLTIGATTLHRRDV